MLAGVILDMSMNATIASSLQLGSSILGSLEGITSLHQKRVEQAGFAVLKSPDVPSILVETGFISNARDSARLVTARHQQAVAEGLFVEPAALFPEEPAGEQLYGLGPGTEKQPGLTAGHAAAGERGAGATGAGKPVNRGPAHAPRVADPRFTVRGQAGEERQLPVAAVGLSPVALADHFETAQIRGAADRRHAVGVA